MICMAMVLLIILDVRNVDDQASVLYDIYDDYRFSRLHCPRNVCEDFLSRNVYSQHLQYIMNGQ